MMGSGASFIPQPMMNPGFPIPDPEVGSAFYNPKQTQADKNELKGFLSSLLGVFDLVPSEQREELLLKMETNNIPEGEELPVKEGNVDFSDLLNDSNDSIDEHWVEDLLVAHGSKKGIDSVHAAFGKKLDKFLEKLAGYGAYDSQLLLPLLKTINGLSLDAPTVSESQIDSLSGGQVDACASLLGVSNDKGAVREKINKIAKDIAALPKFEESSLVETIRSVEVQAVTPAIGMVGANIVGKSITRTQEENFKVEEKKAKELERDKKRAEGKQKANQREMMAKAMAAKASKDKSEKNINKRREKK